MAAQMTPRNAEEVDESSSVFSANSRHSAYKAAITKYRGLAKRPLATAIARAQEKEKPFISDPSAIDHNTCVHFLGVLRDAGISWKPKELPEDRDQAAAIMNAVTQTIDAYKDYQADVINMLSELESNVIAFRVRDDSHKTEVQKLQADKARLLKENCDAEREHLKEVAALKEALAAAEAKAQSLERVKIDLDTKNKKLEKAVADEKKTVTLLTAEIHAVHNPRFRKTTSTSRVSRPRTTNGSTNGSVPPSDSGLNDHAMTLNAWSTPSTRNNGGAGTAQTERLSDTRGPSNGAIPITLASNGSLSKTARLFCESNGVHGSTDGKVPALNEEDEARRDSADGTTTQVTPDALAATQGRGPSGSANGVKLDAIDSPQLDTSSSSGAGMGATKSLKKKSVWKKFKGAFRVSQTISKQRRVAELDHSNEH